MCGMNDFGSHDYINERTENNESLPPHYYGDAVRKIFVIMGIVMLGGIPFFNQYLPRPLVTSIFAVIIFASVAGFTRPFSQTAALINVFVSLAGVLTFESYTLYSFFVLPSSGVLTWNVFMIVSQLLAILSFIAFYYSVKTLRGAVRATVGETGEMGEKGRYIKVPIPLASVGDILVRYGRKREDIKEIFWSLMSGGANEESAAQIITNARYLHRYLDYIDRGLNNIEATRRILTTI